MLEQLVLLHKYILVRNFFLIQYINISFDANITFTYFAAPKVLFLQLQLLLLLRLQLDNVLILLGGKTAMVMDASGMKLMILKDVQIMEIIGMLVLVPLMKVAAGVMVE